jgi:hypothetical protein
MATIDSARIDFPSGEFRVQSPYLYLQSAGSTGADGSTYGAHVRWLLNGNLGESHLPKGDFAATSVNFNRPRDYVALRRSRYVERFPTVVDFSVAPNVVNDTLGFWIYTTNTKTVVYIYFRNTARYGTVRASVDPAVQPLEFVKQYCPDLIEAELKEALFFAAEIDVIRDQTTEIRVETLSVDANVPLPNLFVSCRRRFGNEVRRRPGGPVQPPLAVSREAAAASPAAPPDAPACCDGPNLLRDGGFEVPPLTAQPEFETDYVVGGRIAGAINITDDARKLNGSWVGLPHSGGHFLTVDGSTTPGRAVLRYKFKVEARTDYCFSGWLSTLFANDVSIPIDVRFTAPDGTVQTFHLKTPAKFGVWEAFTLSWSSGTSNGVTIEILSASVLSFGNDFGIDDLWFCKAKQKASGVRIRAENIRSLRFDIVHGYPSALQFETYRDYMAGALWERLGDLALTPDDNTVFQRLEPSPGAVNGQWQKFNDHAVLNVANYQDRWTRTGGLREAVQQYITRSNTDPRAVTALAGAVQPQDGSVDVSLLDALRMVSLDFHVARMLGLGYLDRDIHNDADEFIYLAAYDTSGPLDDTNIARPVRHYYMGIPTSPLDYRLPDAPFLKDVAYGLTIDNGEPQPSLLTDAQGYTPDGLSRYVNLFLKDEADINSLAPFFVPPVEFCSIDKTAGVFYGVEYRKQGETAWRKPEIAHDTEYADLDVPPHSETVPLPNNNDVTRPILRHDERENGIHVYGAYGINWFSRASAVGNIVATDATLIRKAVRLLPPANFAVQLIQHESPLMLTTTTEQDMLAQLSGTDKTLVRVTFDYFHVHDVNYQFGDAVELFFRSEIPRNVVGAIKSVIDDPADSSRAIVRTMSYVVNSQGTTIAPALDATLFGNFAGGVFTSCQENYIVTNVAASGVAGEGPVFTVQKNVRGNTSSAAATGPLVTVQDLIAPDAGSAASGPVMFMAVENMADPNSWGTPNPLSKVVTIGDSTWTTHTETVIRDGDTITETLRGVVAPATITADLSAPAGVYRIEFQSYALQHHPQSGDADPVEWSKGVVRVPVTANPTGPKKVFEILLVEHLGDGQPLVLHAVDNAFDPTDSLDVVTTTLPVAVNYYPGYKVYLHADAPRNFDEAAMLPAAGEGQRKTWLAARSRDTTQALYSAVGIPVPIVALEFVTPLPPAQPIGPEFATWPDFYYKSTYTFLINFVRKPFATAIYRGNDETILRALYKDETYNAVREQLRLFGEDDPFSANRWKNLLGFTYTGASDTFQSFPPTGGYAFPNPDKGGALNGSPPGSIRDAVKEAIWGAFTALTEMPLIYDFIRGSAYTPVPRAQNIRNTQGGLLPPTDPAFDMAPMAKKTGNGFEIQFTDFTLDGTGNNIFFYLGREIGNRGRLGDPGPIAGPVRLINTRPPDSPAIKRTYVQEAKPLTGSGPAVKFEINAYPDVQKVQRVLIYRATDPADAMSVRTMQVIKTVDLAGTNQLGNLSILLSDDFEDGFVPYGDPLLYRIVALRAVRNPAGGTHWAPSQPSKVVLIAVMDSINPDPPEITFTSDGLSGTPAQLTGVNLSWSPTRHNGTYYLDKMSSVGNWITIYRVKTNQNVTIDLAATDLGTNVLPKESEDDATRTLYHRFRVRAENASGLFSLTDKVLTI